MPRPEPMSLKSSGSIRAALMWVGNDVDAWKSGCAGSTKRGSVSPHVTAHSSMRSWSTTRSICWNTLPTHCWRSPSMSTLLIVRSFGDSLGSHSPCPRLTPPGPQARHQVVDRADRVGELGRAGPDPADDVGIAAADAAVAVLGRLLDGALVLARDAAAVVDLDHLDAGHRTLVLVVGEQADVLAPRVARSGEPAAACGGVDDVRQRVVDAPEVDGVEEVVVDAEHEAVAVVGLDLAGFQDQQPVLVLQRPVVALGVELAVLGEHDAVERQLLALDPLAVVVDLRPSVVGHHRVGVEVEDHAGRNRGTAIASSSWRGVDAKSATTACPMASEAGSAPTTFVSTRGPSSSST